MHPDVYIMSCICSQPTIQWNLSIEDTTAPSWLSCIEMCL